MKNHDRVWGEQFPQSLKDKIKADKKITGETYKKIEEFLNKYFEYLTNENSKNKI